MKRSLPAILVSLGPLGWVFLKIGCVFFGGGFVLIPLLHRELVENLRWLTERQFLDGIAISQLTPGPVAVLATYCGFHQAGVAGALVATAAVFLPAVTLMLFISHSYTRLSAVASVRSVLNMIIPAIVGLLVATAIQTGQKTITNPIEIAMAVFALVLMIRWKVSPAILIGAGAVLGLLLRL